MRVAVLPTRDAVLLPGAVNELQVGRPGSVAALRHAAEHGEQVLVVLQRDPDVDDPGPEDLHGIGTICRVTDAERMSAEAACVGVLGIERVRIVVVERSGDALFAEVKTLAWAPVEPPMPELLKESLGFLVEQGLGANFSARTFQALRLATTVRAGDGAQRAGADRCGSVAGCARARGTGTDRGGAALTSGRELAGSVAAVDQAVVGLPCPRPSPPRGEGDAVFYDYAASASARSLLREPRSL
ncbi:MAG: LON peptidase substrate-binding domain-containing protein [Archangium sp.]|nr:LON peptidase substrate-binding domain-containing protein [Archangium sp.]